MHIFQDIFNCMVPWLKVLSWWRVDYNARKKKKKRILTLKFKFVADFLHVFVYDSHVEIFLFLPVLDVSRKVIDQHTFNIRWRRDQGARSRAKRFETSTRSRSDFHFPQQRASPLPLDPRSTNNPGPSNFAPGLFARPLKVAFRDN